MLALEPVRGQTLTAPAGGVAVSMPAIIERAGPRAAGRTLEFFTAAINNANTRRAYGRAASDFFAWIEPHGLALETIGAVHVAAWVQHLQRHYEATSVKQQLAGLRMLLDYLVSGGVLPANPASAVRGPRHSARRGKTPILDAKQAGGLLASIPEDNIAGLRDRALIGLMTYSFARIGAALGMSVRDVFRERNQLMVRLKEKGGKRHEMPCHHRLDEYLSLYIEAAGIGTDATGPLFRSIDRSSKGLSERPLTQVDAWRAVNRRAKAAGIEGQLCNHTFRGTGITAYLEAGGSLEQACSMANHADMRTTRLYDRRDDKVTRAGVELIRLE
jgi:site-specific recombinase XerD